MSQPITHSQDLELQYHVVESIDTPALNFIKFEIFAVPEPTENDEENEHEDDDDLDSEELSTDYDPYIEIKIKRIIMDEESNDNLIDIADMDSADLYNVARPLFSPHSQEFVANIFNIDNVFDLSHFVFINEVKLHNGFPEDCVAAALAKALSSLSRGVPKAQFSGGIFKRDTFYYGNTKEELDYNLIDKTMMELNLFELSPSISGFPANTNKNCLFSGTFLNKEIKLVHTEKKTIKNTP